MEWLDLILGIGASAASGGVLGILGGAVSAWFKVKEKREERSWQREKWDYNLKVRKLNMEAGDRETENEVLLSNTDGRWDNLGKSYEHDAAMNKGLPEWAQLIKALFRPILTVLLVIFDAWIFYTLVKELSYEAARAITTLIGEAAAKELLTYLVFSHVFACVTACLWWFAERAFIPSKFKR